ncbi:MAG: hybrid sensor histidine kinase/response regulator [Bacteroidales bacterium]|nr:MAG: hybrid sensor histidine kinase/response regulator [Bacteroidales bacterium]
MTLEKTHINLKTAVYVTILTAIVFIVLFAFIGVKNRKYAYEDSKALAKEISRKAALETEIYLSSALMVARSIEQKSRIIREAGLERKKVVNLLVNAIQRNPNFLAAWTMWEPNAFDNSDKEFIGDTLYDDKGTMSLCFFKYDNNLLFEKDEISDFNADYYAIPKRYKTELLIGPFYYQYGGYPYVFYETSVIVPVIEDSIFLGVFGIDINLENLKDKLNSVKLYKSGYLSLISNNGTIISHADSSFIKKNIFKIVNEPDSITFKTIKEGKELAFELKSEFTNLKVFRFLYPIKIGNGNTPWSMMVEIPINEANTRSKQLLFIAFFTLFIGISLLVFLIINILDRKQYERNLLEAIKKVKESDELKTAFLNNISHEIRTPLNGIIGFSDLLTNTEPSKEAKQNFNEIIRSSCNQLLSIISNVLELSKIQTGNVALIITEVSIEQSISIIVQTYEKSAKDNGLSINMNLPHRSSRFMLRTDAGKLHQILSNLISNAIKFTQSGFIEIGFEEKKSAIQLYVKDSGIGISSENSKYMYEIFTHGDQSISRKYGGVGIGLSITKAFVELLGGKIWFESELNKGTTFYFTLPYDKTPIKLSKNNVLELNSLTNFKILVTDDEQSNFILINELFKNTNAELIWAKDGNEAIMYCQQDESINLVLMDIKLPGMNGYEATKLIKSFRPDLPIIAVSAFIQSKDIEQQIIFDSIISKPFKSDEFISTILKYT